MRGVILAGGTGSRLSPMTKVTNKHLLPVWDRPMCYWPLQILLDNDIRDIMVITGREHAGHVFGLLGSGAAFGCEFTFRVQDEAGGIAQALSLAEDFVKADMTPAFGGTCTVVLGDTMMLPSPKIVLEPQGAEVFLQKVAHPEAYGVVKWASDARIIEKIVEKPQTPPSSYAVAGLYLYPYDVFGMIQDIRPSDRGELEITDVNNAYAQKERLTWHMVPDYWGDMGTIEGLHAAAVHAKAAYERQKRGTESGDWRRDGPPSNAPVGG